MAVTFEGMERRMPKIEKCLAEYGIANLWGKSNADRARALIDIAHPDFRPELKDQMEEMFHQKY